MQRKNDKQVLQQEQNQAPRQNIFKRICLFFVDLFIFLLKLSLYYGNIIADIFLCTKYWNEGKHYFGVLVAFIVICHLYKVYEISFNEHRLYGLKGFLEFIGIGQLLRYLFQSWYTTHANQITIYQGIMESAPSFMINILSIFYEVKPINWDISASVYQQAQTAAFAFSMVNLFYSNYIYFYQRYEDFKKADYKMKILFTIFNFGEYSARVCSWVLAAYFGGKVFVWTIIGVDVFFAIIASCKRLADHRLIPYYDFVFCYRMYDCYLFYGDQFDSRGYVNLKEFERFGIQIAVVIFVIQQVTINTDNQIFFYAVLYVCIIGIIINFIYTANRLLYKKDDESEIIKTYKRMIENLENEKTELNLKIRHIAPQQARDEENKATIAKMDEEMSQLNADLNAQLKELQQQVSQQDALLKEKDKEKKDIVEMNMALEELKIKYEFEIKQLKDKVSKLEKALMAEKQLCEDLRGDRAIFEQHLANERKIVDQLKRENYYLQHEQAVPPFYGEDLQKQLDQIKKQGREAEERWKTLEQMYKKREQELKEQLYKQANHDIEINSFQTVSTVLKKQNEMVNQKFKEKEAQVIVCQSDIKEMKEEIKKLKEINKNLSDKLEYEERLNNQQEMENNLMKDYNPDEYAQNQHTNLSLVYLTTDSVVLNKFEDNRLLSRDTERIVFNNFINMNLLEKISAIVKYPYYFQFSFSKKSSLFNTGQNCQNELFIFSNLATKTYPTAIKAISILAANWLNVTQESFTYIQKIITTCTVMKVLELNLENWEVSSEEVKVRGFSQVFTQLAKCEHLMVLHLNLSGQGNLHQDIWDLLFEGISAQRKLGELQLELSKRGYSSSGVTAEQFEQLCNSIQKLLNLENLALNLSEWRDNQLTEKSTQKIGQMLKQLPKLRYLRINLRHFSNYSIDLQFFEDMLGDYIKQKESKLENISISLDGQSTTYYSYHQCYFSS